jgi:hypothetical protein
VKPPTFFLLCFPGVGPFMSFGNDTQATTPAINDVSLFFEFCSLIWNPGVGGGTASTNSLRARYF